MTKEQIKQIYKQIEDEFKKKNLKHPQYLLTNLKKQVQGYTDQELYNIVNDIDKTPKCAVCGKELKIFNFTKGYANTCSNTCRDEFYSRESNKILDNYYNKCCKLNLNESYSKDFRKVKNAFPELNNMQCKRLTVRVKHDLSEMPVCNICGRIYGYNLGYSDVMPKCKCNEGMIIPLGTTTANTKESIDKQYLAKKEKFGKNNSQVHVKNFENLNREFIYKHFVRDGLFYITEFREYFGYKSKNAKQFKKQWNITEPTFQPNALTTRCSQVETDWLNILNIPVRHKIIYLKSGRNLTVDGYDPDTKTMYEFLGDMWHGNPENFPAGTINTWNGVDCGELYKKTQNRLRFLTKLGYNVKYIWEKDYHEKGPYAYKDVAIDGI